MTYRPPVDVREMLETLAKEDDRLLSHEITALIRAEWARRGKPPVLAGGEDGEPGSE